MKKNQRIKWVIKPTVFIISSLPFIFVILGIILQNSIFQLYLGADPQKYIVHKMGEWTLRFLIITLAITPCRRWLKIPELLQFRRMFGLFVMFYAALHLLAYYLLYLEMDLSNVLEDIVKRPYITVGFLAFLLLIPLAVTSNKAMMKRLGKKWRKLHQLIYIIAGLAILHFIWQVKSDLNEAVLYLLIILILLASRIKRTKKKPASHQTSVTSK